MLGRSDIQLAQIAFDQFEYLIDIAHGGIIDRQKVIALAAIGIEALDHDLGRLAPFGMITSSFGALRRSAAFGFALAKAAAVKANQKYTAVDPIGMAKRNTMPVVHGLPANRAADALNGLNPQFDAMMR